MTLLFFHFRARKTPSSFINYHLAKRFPLSLRVRSLSSSLVLKLGGSPTFSRPFKLTPHTAPPRGAFHQIVSVGTFIEATFKKRIHRKQGPQMLGAIPMASVLQYCHSLRDQDIIPMELESMFLSVLRPRIEANGAVMRWELTPRYQSVDWSKLSMGRGEARFRTLSEHGWLNPNLGSGVTIGHKEVRGRSTRLSRVELTLKLTGLQSRDSRSFKIGDQCQEFRRHLVPAEE
ncbi:hypothetical protein PM082_017522 [Marasmius tenuissimus]|nr:hypothetical protein PM082_017522 [Marasmius tenuissimus]